MLARIPGDRRVSVERETFPALAAEGAVFALASDARVTRYFSWGPYQDEQEPRAWVRSITLRSKSAFSSRRRASLARNATAARWASVTS